MNKINLIGLFFLCLSLSASAQDTLLMDSEVFETEIEKQLWEKGKMETFDLFRAVSAKELIKSEAWSRLSGELEKKKSKTRNDLNFLRILFQKTHKRVLKNYEQHSTFNDLLSQGDFDCVSGSAALGILLERFNYDFDIIETDFHVFIVVNLNESNIILESTLPVGGMITSSSKVKSYLDSYKPKEYAQLATFNQRIGDSSFDLSENSIFRKVNMIQLAGLLYYNDAILDFNSQKYSKASDQLTKAYVLYPSPRVLGLRELSQELAYKTYGYDLK